MSVVQLPTWEECAALVDQAKEGGEPLTALDQFIYNNEPAGKKEGWEWRKTLGNVIDEAEAK